MRSADLREERAYVSRLYDQLDRMRQQAATRLSEALRQPVDTPQMHRERDVTIARYQGQLVQFRAAEHGLCFGRLDLHDGERRYIGRIGIFDEAADYQPLLIDWRAPAARPFYLATAAAPEGVRRRRHLRTDQRTVVDLQDEVLAVDGADGDGDPAAGDAVLLAALAERRTGRMRDIVATIQAEQDRIIRSDHQGVLVVEGGPGTGKTAVALHRAAYLLYTYREQLAQRGVLVVGPNATFLRYIDQVLPSLGETGVRLATIADLFPGIVPRRAEPAEVAEIKGRAVMADVVAAAVRDRQEVPETPRTITTSDTHAGLGYQSETVVLHPAACRAAREHARASKLPHNQARAVFLEYVVWVLAGQVADRLGEDPYAGDPLGGDDAPGEGASLLGDADVAVIADDLRGDPAINAALDELWPQLTPQQLLTDLYASDERLTAAAPWLTEAERRLLRREPGEGWTAADIPLLDEAANLLGEDDSARRAAPRREEAEAVQYARGVLEVAAGSRALEYEDDEVVEVSEVLTAEEIARRQAEVDTRSVAERAAADRRWTYGHVIVDEAQELSPMAWRMLIRRCPSRWMTIVGDPAQTGVPGFSSWRSALEPVAGDRWKLARLSVNYRTAAEIMAVATRVLRAMDGSFRAPRSVRYTGVEPGAHRVADLATGVPEILAREVGEAGGGRTGVIVPATLLPALGPAVTAARDDAGVGGDAAPDVLSHPVAVLTPRQAKGLEFDCVVVVEPAEIVAGSPRGLSDLYVALTRATRRLAVVHTGDLPEPLAHLG